MKYLLSVCLLSALLFSCNQKPAVKSPYFFDFDEVVYYKTDIKTEDVYKIAQSTNKDKRFLYLVWGNTPDKLSDTTFLSYIENVGYTKKSVPVEQHAALKEILREKNGQGSNYTLCTRYYRDIFVLKKKGKMTGVVKICYSCGDVELVGAKANTGCFGSKSDLKELTEIVK